MQTKHTAVNVCLHLCILLRSLAKSFGQTVFTKTKLFTKTIFLSIWIMLCIKSNEFLLQITYLWDNTIADSVVFYYGRIKLWGWGGWEKVELKNNNLIRTRHLTTTFSIVYGGEVHWALVGWGTLTGPAKSLEYWPGISFPGHQHRWLGRTYRVPKRCRRPLCCSPWRSPKSQSVEARPGWTSKIPGYGHPEK